MTGEAMVFPVAVGIAVVFLPGLALAAGARIRGLAALGVAGPLGYAVIGLTGVLAAAVRQPFGLPAVGVVTVVLLGLVLLVRLGCRLIGRPLPAWDSWRPSGWLPVLAGAAVASTAIAVVAFAQVPSFDRISQTYDAVFHLNAVTSIVQSGDASSLHLYRITHPGRTIAYYPAVWHSIAALIAETLRLPIPVAANAAWIATAGPVFSLGCGFASAVLFGSAGLRRDEAVPRQRVLVATAGAVLASGFVAFPYLLLDFGTLYPNGIAYTILPVGMALVAALVPWPKQAPWRPEAPLPRLRTMLLIGGWLTAAAFAHPRSVVAIGVLTAPMLVAWFAARMSALAATGVRGRRRARIGWVLLALAVLAVAAAGAVAVYHYYDLASRPISDHLNGGPARARETLPQALLQGLLATSLVAPTQVALAPSVLLAVVAFAGLIAALLRPGLRWVPVTYLAIVLLYGLAAGSDSDFAKVATGLWDKDKFRILAMLPMIGVPLVAWTVVAGSAELVTTLRTRRARRVDPRPVTLIVAALLATAVLAAVTWTGPALGGVSSAIGTVFALPAHDKHGGLLDADEVSLLSEVGRYVPEGQLIAGNPWNGSALAWTLGGRRVLFPHLGGSYGVDGNRIKRHLDQWDERPRVCRSVKALGVRWVITANGRLAGDAAAAAAFGSIDRVVETKGGAVEVAHVGQAKLWRLTACWDNPGPT